MQADENDAGGELELPLGLPLEVRLPPAGGPWRPGGDLVHVQVEAVEPDDDGTSARVMAVGLGTDLLRFEADGAEPFEVTVTVVEPLFNE